MKNAEPEWVVLKFGGTSVSTPERWASIEKITRARVTDDTRVLMVHSALVGVSDLLEAAIDDALAASGDFEIEPLRQQHQQLAEALGIDAAPLIDPSLEELGQLLSGIALVGEATPRVRARVMAQGEVMSTRLGAAWLEKQGLDCTWLDARDILIAATPREAGERTQFLSAFCDDAPDPGVQEKLANLSGVVLTQGFIASDVSGETVLLGRGGSDTSAALFAAKLEAERLEIWTDVRGMYSADPRQIPSARLLKDLSYEEAQEIASMGAKVVHPRSLPPVRRANIPVLVKSTDEPELDGTLISIAPTDATPRVKAVAVRSGITLVSMTSSEMWRQTGFLAKAFTVFADNGLSIDLVSTSETSVTVSLDDQDGLDAKALDRLTIDLETICRVSIIRGCASVSLVGRGIRAILHKLTPALELFREHPVRLLSQAANDLNFTVVVDEEQASLLASRLHELMVQVEADDPVFGDAWKAKSEDISALPSGAIWWHEKRDELLALMQERGAAYVYDLYTVDRAASTLKELRSISQCFYAMKANANAAILQCVLRAGHGIECVSESELEHVFQHFPDIDPQRVLFTPNFAPRREYEKALALGVGVTLDNLHPLKEWPEMFKGADLKVRIDPERSRGHHRHVHTAGDRAKFGVPAANLAEMRELANQVGARLVGLHAHAGSGILDANHWLELGRRMAGLAADFPDLKHINLGGGLGIPERPGGPAFDMAALEEGLAELKAQIGDIELRLEPGRYLVAEAGVLLARVSQTKRKGQTRYIGIETGMNSLLRPALYSSRHEIVNLTRLDEANDPHPVAIVGPICESADMLGFDRQLPPTVEGDILLIADAGAYGAVMSSRYNLRPFVDELTLGV